MKKAILSGISILCIIAFVLFCIVGFDVIITNRGGFLYNPSSGGGGIVYDENGTSSGGSGGGASIPTASYDSPLDGISTVSLSGTDEVSNSYKNAKDSLTRAFNNSLIDANEYKTRLLVVKIACQLVQYSEKTGNGYYALANGPYYNFYSLDYSKDCSTLPGESGHNKYSINSVVSAVKNNKKIYTDCMGFCRMVYSLASVQINPTSPASASGVGYGYGYSFSYSDTKLPAFSKHASLLLPGDVVFDPDTHALLYLYSWSEDSTNYVKFAECGSFDITTGKYVFNSSYTNGGYYSRGSYVITNYRSLM